jgi:hypothetical protein
VKIPTARKSSVAVAEASSLLRRRDQHRHVRVYCRPDIAVRQWHHCRPGIMSRDPLVPVTTPRGVCRDSHASAVWRDLGDRSPHGPLSFNGRTSWICSVPRGEPRFPHMKAGKDTCFCSLPWVHLPSEHFKRRESTVTSHYARQSWLIDWSCCRYRHSKLPFSSLYHCF